MITMKDSSISTEWGYWRCGLDAPAAAFGIYSTIVTAWRDRIPPGERLPRRGAFDFTDFRGWWGRVAIARIERAPFDVRFTLWGTTLRDWWGVDYTNRRIGEAAKNPEAWTLTEGLYFAEMTQAPFIGIAAGNLSQHDRSYISVVSLDLPVGDENGVSHVFALHLQVPKGQGPADVMPECPMQPIRSDV